MNDIFGNCGSDVPRGIPQLAGVLIEGERNSGTMLVEYFRQHPNQVWEDWLASWLREWVDAETRYDEGRFWSRSKDNKRRAAQSEPLHKVICIETHQTHFDKSTDEWSHTTCQLGEAELDTIFTHDKLLLHLAKCFHNELFYHDFLYHCWQVVRNPEHPHYVQCGGYDQHMDYRYDQTRWWLDRIEELVGKEQIEAHCRELFAQQDNHRKTWPQNDDEADTQI